MDLSGCGLRMEIQPLTDRSRFDNWLAIVHAHYQSGWNMYIVGTPNAGSFFPFSKPLIQMVTTSLDSLCHFHQWVHHPDLVQNIPVHFGNAGFCLRGIILVICPEDFVNSSGMLESGFSMNQSVQLLHLFGLTMSILESRMLYFFELTI